MSKVKPVAEDLRIVGEENTENRGRSWWESRRQQSARAQNGEDETFSLAGTRCRSGDNLMLVHGRPISLSFGQYPLCSSPPRPFAARATASLVSPAPRERAAALPPPVRLAHRPASPAHRPLLPGGAGGSPLWHGGQPAHGQDPAVTCESAALCPCPCCDP